MLYYYHCGPNDLMQQVPNFFESHIPDKKNNLLRLS